MKSFNPIPTGCCHVTLIYGLIPPMAARNRVKCKQQGSLEGIVGHRDEVSAAWLLNFFPLTQGVFACSKNEKHDSTNE